MGGGASKTQTGPVLDPVVYAELLGKVRRAGELMIAHLKIDPDEPEGAASFLRAFGQLDSNHDGLISYEDLHDVLTNLDEKLTDEEVGDVLRAADLDGNGQIDYPEFVVFFKAIGKPPSEAARAPPPLHDIVDALKRNLALDGTWPEAVDAACLQLGVAPTGSLQEKADACWRAMEGNASRRGMGKVAPDPVALMDSLKAPVAPEPGAYRIRDASQETVRLNLPIVLRESCTKNGPGLTGIALPTELKGRVPEEVWIKHTTKLGPIVRGLRSQATNVWCSLFSILSGLGVCPFNLGHAYYVTKKVDKDLRAWQTSFNADLASHGVFVKTQSNFVDDAYHPQVRRWLAVALTDDKVVELKAEPHLFGSEADKYCCLEQRGLCLHTLID